jgi:hypothetical protein
MRVIGRNYLFLVLCAASFGAGGVMAEDRHQPPGHGPQGPQGPQGPHPKPPEAAFSACNDLQQDDVCEVDLGDKTIEGKCVPARDEARLLCLPDHPPGAPGQQR